MNNAPHLRMKKNMFIYYKPGCPYCKKAIKAIQIMGIPYQKYNVTGKVNDFTRYTGKTTVPQIYAKLPNDHRIVPIGGFSELSHLIRTKLIK